MTEHCQHSRIDECAANWWLQSQQTMSAEQQRAMQTWLSADPRHAAAYQAIQQTSARLDALRNTATRPARKAIIRARPIWALACCLLLCLTLFWQYWPQGAQYRQAWQSDQQLLQIALPEGSQIVLDQHSEAAVALYPDRREVLLAHGQAFFDVSKDSHRPFIITAGTRTITVLGTRFSVRHEADVLRVEVASGLVKVSDQQHTRLLSAGEGMRISDENWQPTRQLAAGSVGSWQQQLLVFDNTPLPEALAEFARYGAPAVQLASPRLQTLRITGSFRYDQPRQFLALLPSVLPVRLEQTAGQWTLYPRQS